MQAAEDIRGAVLRFRRALDQGGFASVGLQAFPLGACGDSSDLLGEYLQELGHGSWEWCPGRLPVRELWSHAWLERDGFVIDVTADQFDPFDEPVILERPTAWHRALRPLSGRRPAGFTGIEYRMPFVLSALREDYQLLRSRANEI